MIKQERRKELLGLAGLITLRLNRHGGSELEYEATRQGLETIISGQSVTWCNAATLSQPQGRMFRLEPGQRQELSRLLREINHRANTHQLKYRAARQLLRAVAHGRVITMPNGQTLYIAETELAICFDADYCSLPVTEVVAPNSVPHKVLMANHITTLGLLCLLSVVELARLIHSEYSLAESDIIIIGLAKIRHVTLADNQVASIVYELERRGLHLIQLSKRVPPGPDDRWIYLSRDHSAFPVVLESQIRHPGSNPIPIEWLLNEYDRGIIAVLHSLGITTIDQLLEHTQSSIAELLASHTGGNIQATVYEHNIVWALRTVGLSLAPEPTANV